MTDYSNILRALQSGTDYSAKADNYRAFDELMKQGVSLPDILRRLEALEAKEREPSPDAGLFKVMESAVAEDPEVVKAKEERERLMETVLTEACLKDPRFAKADKDYRTAVNSAYVKMKQ